MTNEWKELSLATCQVARRAGQYLRDERRRFRPERIEEKHAHDFVSYVDREAERLVVEGLHRLLPDAGFLTEEGTAAYDGEAACWIVDPLDGTTNFIHDLPPFAVSVALAVGGTVKVGVVYEACRDECFYAWQGGGAWLDGRPIHVDSSSPLGRTLVGVELPYEATAYAPTGHCIIDRFYGQAAGLRMNGSAATSLAYVAAGRFGAGRFIRGADPGQQRGQTILLCCFHPHFPSILTISRPTAGRRLQSGRPCRACPPYTDGRMPRTARGGKSRSPSFGHSPACGR